MYRKTTPEEFAKIANTINLFRAWGPQIDAMREAAKVPEMQKAINVLKFKGQGKNVALAGLGGVLAAILVNKILEKKKRTEEEENKRKIFLR